MTRIIGSATVLGLAIVVIIHFHAIARFVFWLPLALMFLVFDWIGRP